MCVQSRAYRSPANQQSSAALIHPPIDSVLADHSIVKNADDETEINRLVDNLCHPTSINRSSEPWRS